MGPCQNSPQPINRIVLLGASNLTLSLNLVTRLIQDRCGRPSEVLIAAGHGRSYGHYSQVLVRGLPGITSCNLWAQLESGIKLPTYAFLTDIGNDLPYGHTPEKLLEWVSWCVDQLMRQETRIVMTNIPIVLIESLSDWHFKIIRSIFFPFSRLSRNDLVARAKVVHQGLEEMATDMKFQLYEQDPGWFGPDIVHVLYWKRKAVYQNFFNQFQVCDDKGKKDGYPRPQLAGWRQHPRFACKKLLGRERRHPQPSARLDDGTTISMY